MKILYIYIIENYSTIKINESWIVTDKQMELEKIIHKKKTTECSLLLEFNRSESSDVSL